jgi:protein disulfide-isomerase A1
MMRSALLSSLVLSYFSVWAIDKAALDSAFNDENIVKLTPSTFDTEIKSETPMLVEFYADWCGHCKNLAPEYAEAAKALKESGIKVASINCSEKDFQDFCSKKDIQGFPTLRIYSNGNFEPYQGGRKADNIIKYMKK